MFFTIPLIISGFWYNCNINKPPRDGNLRGHGQRLEGALTCLLLHVLSVDAKNLGLLVVGA